jgi:hypothetical protein
MKIKGLKKCGVVPEKVTASNGKVYETGENVQVYSAPDGFKATYGKFVKEIERGRLHGCIVASS